MFLEGAPRLAEAGLHVPGLRENGDRRVAVEAYPGLAARQLGVRRYKNDTPDTAAQKRLARRAILHMLSQGAPLGLVVSLPGLLVERCVEDGSGDRLDGVLCAAQASWAAQRAAQRYGVPPDVDPVEGWIATVAPYSG